MSPPSSLLPPCHRAVRMDEHYCSPLARLAAADSPRGRVTRVSLGSPRTLPSAQPSPPPSHASASPDRPVSVQGFTLTARLSLPGPHHAIGPDLPAARCEDARTVRFCLLGSPSGSGSAAVSNPQVRPAALEPSADGYTRLLLLAGVQPVLCLVLRPIHDDHGPAAAPSWGLALFFSSL